jgi:hypothetical protein
MRPQRLGLIAICCVSLAHPVTAFEVTSSDETGGQTLTVGGESVSVTVRRSNAQFNNRLTVEDEPSPEIPCKMPQGFTVFLGWFDAPTELVMSLTTSEGDLWVTGPGDRNADAEPHAHLTVTGPDTVLVEWEDQSGAGDADYDDCVVELNIAPAH